MTYHIPFRRALGSFLITLLIPVAALAQQTGSSITNAKIFDAIGVRDGVTVCEMGAGDGELSIAAARAVGVSGRVFTSELGDERVKSLQNNVKKSGLTHITVVAGDAARTNFPDAGCDGLFMRNVYHHFADPPTVLASIAASLKAGGRLAIVDFGPPPGSEAPVPADRGKDGMHGITAETLSRELRQAGFEAVSTEVGSQRWFMIVVAKPKDSPCPENTGGLKSRAGRILATDRGRDPHNGGVVP